MDHLKFLTEKVQTFAAKYGERPGGLGYLGKGPQDATNTIIDPNFKMLRKVFYHTKIAGIEQPYATAILWERSGIAYEDTADNKGRAVRLGYPAGDDRLHVLGPATIEGLNDTAGETHYDRRLPRRIYGFHDAAAIVTGNGLVIAHDAAENHGFYAFQNAPANGDKFSLGCFLRKGTYTFWAIGRTSNQAGKIDWKLDGGTAFSAAEDWYSGGTVYNVRKTTGSVVVAQSGYHVLTGTINGKNAGSSNYFMELTAYGFIPSAD